ncbi:phosphoribosylformylglycinamidine synthase subunit PurQ [Patescibacteria group bacterium]|nr:phosphoribosylformylglycinamidine synthase subunit PurQ [Patescibacteria group bacterium]
MATPRVLVFSGYGLNCEEETAFAFESAGGRSDVAHINDVIDGRIKLDRYQILAFPGGFSYGDDTGSGQAFGNKLRHHLWDELLAFVRRDTLTIGICNGFQIIANLGLVPAVDRQYGDRQLALLHNDSARYTVRWVDLEVTGHTPWLRGIRQLSIPIAHGEGKVYADPETLSKLNRKGQVALRYVSGEICRYLNLPANPNGSLEDIAGVTDESGRILGLMPHPERALFFTQLPHWPLLREQYRRRGEPIPETASGRQIFENGIRYFA